MRRGVIPSCRAKNAAYLRQGAPHTMKRAAILPGTSYSVRLLVGFDPLMEDFMPDVVTFGEAMIRLSPPHFQRLEQTSTLDVQVGGGELNVAVRSEEHTSELQSRQYLVCRLL